MKKLILHYLQSIEEELEKSEIKNTGLILETYHIKVKFKTAEEQLKAKSLIQKALGKRICSCFEFNFKFT